VAIVNNKNSAEIKINNPFLIKSPENKIIYSASHLGKTNIIATGNEIIIGHLPPFSYKIIRIIPKEQEGIYINGRQYRGDISIINKDSRLIIVNNVNLEDYLKGVLCFEISSSWPAEAIKAHAVVSRSFALYQISINKNKDFDVTSDVFSQVYVGKTTEKWKINRLVDETKGYVLFYENKVLAGFFHACCGGHTEDASNLWNINLLPLKGVVCPYCKGTKHYWWKRRISLKYIEQKLKKIIPHISKIVDIIAGERNSSSRIKTLTLVCENGDEITLNAKDFRQAIGPDLVRSTNFEVTVEEDTAIFEGLGWGHGVGMCQWGANYMAKAKADYKKILKFYFPGSSLIQYYK